MAGLPTVNYLDDVLIDLIGRMDKAEAVLTDMAEEHKPRSTERNRLGGKANGVALARSYVREELTRILRIQEAR